MTAEEERPAADAGRLTSAVSQSALSAADNSMRDGWTLWPQDPDRTNDRELVNAYSDWAALLQKWYFTVECFLYPISRYGGDPQLSKYLTQRVILHAALVASNSEASFWDCLRNEIVATLSQTVPTLLAAQDLGARDATMVQAFLALNPLDQLLKMLYEYRVNDRGPSSVGFIEGRFDANDLARLFGKGPEAIRQAASRARIRHAKYYEAILRGDS